MIGWRWDFSVRVHRLAKLIRWPCEVFGRAQQMTGSFNRLLAKAPKRRLQRRGGAWQEGDFHFRGCFEKKLNDTRREERNFELVDFGVPLSAVVGRRFLCQTNHYRPCTRVELIFDVRTLTRLIARFSFSALRSLFSRFNSSSTFVPWCSSSYSVIPNLWCPAALPSFWK